MTTTAEVLLLFFGIHKSARTSFQFLLEKSFVIINALLMIYSGALLYGFSEASKLFPWRCFRLKQYFLPFFSFSVFSPHFFCKNIRKSDIRTTPAHSVYAKLLSKPVRYTIGCIVYVFCVFGPPFYLTVNCIDWGVGGYEILYLMLFNNSSLWFTWWIRYMTAIYFKNWNKLTIVKDYHYI